MKDHPCFSIVTPSLNMLPYLKNCVKSVEDQEHVECEHIVVDGISTDGTVQWLQQNSKTKNIIEKDRSMYDAINKGLKIAQGRILAYLNCDEQYLNGTLEWVKNYFDRHEDVEVLFGDILLIRPSGSLVAYRKAYKPRWRYILSSHLYLPTCAMFFKRRIVEDRVLMNPDYACLGDVDFVVRVLRAGYCVKHVKRYMSAFTMTGTNLSLDKRAETEKTFLLSQFPGLPSAMTGVLNLARWGEKFFCGSYFQSSPLIYAVYTDKDKEKREEFCVKKASFRWRYE
jgi:glycosyltransferase involved in cell wall biosynthesis